MNPNAAEFIPFQLQSQQLQSQPDFSKLWGFPFFQQRLERFLYKQHRIADAHVADLKVLMPSPPIQPQQKATVVFMGIYKNIPLLYEANRWDDPRTGVFVKIV